MFDFIPDFLSTIPGISSFVKSSDEQNMQGEYGKNQALWQKLLDNYQGPENDPQYAAELEKLRGQGDTGLTPSDRAAMLDAYSGASSMAQGREGAIAQNQMMRGGGVANSGQSAVLQQQAAQAAAGRYQHAGTQQAGIASQRALQARQGYLNTMERNKAALNQYKLYATGGMTGANNQMANYYGASDASRKSAAQHAMDTAASMVSGGMGGGGGGGYHAQPYGTESYLRDDPFAGGGYT